MQPLFSHYKYDALLRQSEIDTIMRHNNHDMILRQACSPKLYLKESEFKIDC